MRVVHTRLAAALAIVSLAPTQFAATHSRVMAPAGWRAQFAVAAPQKTAPQSTPSLQLPITFERQVGDLDGMGKRHLIRALVVPGRSSFFYDKGQPHGIYYETFDEFQRFANRKLKTGSSKIAVTFIPVRLEQLEQALLEGVGDIIAYGVIVTPEREQKVLFK